MANPSNHHGALRYQRWLAKLGQSDRSAQRLNVLAGPVLVVGHPRSGKPAVSPAMSASSNSAAISTRPRKPCRKSAGCWPPGSAATAWRRKPPPPRFSGPIPARAGRGRYASSIRRMPHRCLWRQNAVSPSKRARRIGTSRSSCLPESMVPVPSPWRWREKTAYPAGHAVPDGASHAFRGTPPVKTFWVHRG